MTLKSKKAVVLSANQFVKEILSIIRRYLPEKDYQVFLFGSWAKGDALDTSDVDIGILGKKEVDRMLIIRIKQEVEALPTLRSADIVDLKGVDERFKKEVLSYGKQL